MALPSSGPLSIADIRNEGVTGGCYSAGSPYSLGSLATAFGIPTDPDSISEFYGRSCPTTTTSTTTSTTTVAYTVNIYIRQGTTPTPAGSAAMYRSINGINWTYSGPIDTTTCTLYPVNTFTVPSGTTLYIGVVNSSNIDVYFNAAASSTCPSNAAIYCFGGFSQTITANTNIAVTAYVAKFGTYVECGGFCTEC